MQIKYLQKKVLQGSKIDNNAIEDTKGWRVKNTYQILVQQIPINKQDAMPLKAW